MSLSKRRRLRHLFYGFVGKYAVKLIGLTCRFEIHGLDAFIKSASQNKSILMLWHNRLVMMGELLVRYASSLNYAALISDSRDGEMLSYLVNNSGIGRSIRVPHNARAAALQTLIKEMKKSDDVIIITPDGPKGPIYKVKPGIVLAAKKNKAQIIPLSWTASRFWTLSTWDGLMIPKPFSKITFQFAPPLFIENQPGQDLEAQIEKLEMALRGLETNH